MLGSAVFRTGVAPGGALAGPWVQNSLWTAARAVPSLDLRFAYNKSLVDAVTGAQLVTFTRASSGTYVGSDGLIKSAATTNEPRFDHNPTTGESLGLLVEEARTNSVTNNTMVGAVAGTPGTLPTSWGVFIAPTGLTRTIVGSGTVNGINYIDVRFNGTPSSTGEITLYLSPATTATLAQAWTATAWLSIAGGSTSNIATISLRNFELNSGVYVRETGTNVVSNISSDLVRRQTVTTSFGLIANQIQLALSLFATAGGTPIDITLRIGLPQLEQGAFATSPILTSTATATRAADVASIGSSAFTSFYNQSEGTVFAECAVAQPNTGGNQFVFRTSDNTFNNAIAVNIPGQATLSTASGGVFDGNVASVASLTANVSAKIGAAYASNNLSISLNGATTVIDATATIPTALNRADIGSDHTGVNRVKAGTIKRLTYWPTRLSNLPRITQP